MGCSVRLTLLATLLVLAPTLVGQGQTVPRRPRGIYAVVNIKEQINIQQLANPSITPAQLEAFFVNLYQNLLSDPAISGLVIYENWATVNPNPPAAANAYDWTYLDDAFSQASAWNTQNLAQAPRTIQLVVSPGFNSPQWMLDQIPSCDGLFQIPVQTPSSTCGKATFAGFVEGGGVRELPMPWNSFYKSSWQTFLKALAARYVSNPFFVSISVAGPTASSEEMILPDNANTPAQDQFGGILSNAMWLKLLAFHYTGMTAYQRSDQGFIDEWNAAIDMYGKIFSGVTLVATTGGGLPNLSATGFTVPSGFSADCPNPDMDCAAETTILSYFEKPTVGGANAKATQEDGMEAARASLGLFNLGVDGIKLVSQMTAQLPPPSAQVLGGAQFNSSFVNFTLGEGCTSKFPPNASDTPAGCSIPPTCTVQGCIPVECIPQACLAPGVSPADLTSYKILSKVPANDLISPEQAAYNVLQVYFNGTPAAPAFGVTQGTAPLNYLQIYSPDILYAQMNANAPAQVVETSGATVALSAQDLLNLASSKLLQISEPPLLPVISSNGVVPATIEPGEWVSIYGSNLAPGIANWNGDFPTSLGGTSVTIDGKAAYLSYVNPTQINLQVPDDTAMGSVPVVVTTAVGTVTSTATLASFSPSFFSFDGKHVAGIIVRSGGYDLLGPAGTSLGYPTVAAKAGDLLELYGTGFGPTNPAVPSGQAFSGAAPTTSPVTVSINSVNVPLSFAGLSGAGLYQFNLIVPSGLGTGDVSLRAGVGGIQTPTGVVISLQ